MFVVCLAFAWVKGFFLELSRVSRSGDAPWCVVLGDRVNLMMLGMWEIDGVRIQGSVDLAVVSEKLVWWSFGLVERTASRSVGGLR